MEPLHGVRRASASASAAIAALTTAVYVVVILQEGNNSFWSVFPWVMIMLIGTFAALASALALGPGVGRLSAIAATVILGVLGLLAIFSVGVGFILAAVLACLAAVSYSSTARTS
ncbi:hypothetical protein EXE58_11295 [Nocardioides seonyuensis]|uniref:Uncharacterized protein n=1 Tax=Nocardioides seonyuensis TaxID=2518371 RepID=A0A4P7IFM7_9ACTN|nr:hypothetical protein [Nocardioides seonyuensis]QBX55988.1 hypothetical protein EXE58_11295 [Nocardioides seonyuensis]